MRCCKVERPAEAEQTYPSREADRARTTARVATQLAAAQAQRQAALVAMPERQRRRRAAGLPGGVAARRGRRVRDPSRACAQLNQQRNQSAPALASYIAANALKPGDRGVALGIVALTDAGPRKDAVSLAARGSALLTLKRGREALAALQQAQALAPAMPDLKARIAKAQTLARREPVAAANSTGNAASADTSTRVADNPAATPGRRYSNLSEPGRSH